jgi:hypothetical protein
MKTLFLGAILLLTTTITFSQCRYCNSAYKFTLGVNLIDNNNNVDNAIPLVKGDLTFTNPMFISVERLFDENPNFSIGATVSSNELNINSEKLSYYAVDLSGQYYFNEYLFDSEDVEMYAGLGLGRYFLDKQGASTFNFLGGAQFWFSDNFGISSQLVGKIGINPMPIDVVNHYQMNFGLIWRN